MTPKQYLTRQELGKLNGVRVFNLSSNYGYQSKGYYVSLLAEARGHNPIPNVKNIQDIKAPGVVRSMSDELEALIQKSFHNIKSKEFTLSIYFGHNLAKQHDKLSQELHKLFQAPFIRAKFHFSQTNKKWVIQGIKTIAFSEIPENHLPFVMNAAREYFSKKRYDTSKVVRYRYDMAILTNPQEQSPPSDKKALQKFTELAEKNGFYVEMITKEDYNRLGEFDALFIRETTSVNHHTYRFARRAQSEGLAVLDDPDSILKCTNKVYLAELLDLARIPAPRTLIVHSENKHTIFKDLGLPCVLKLPDSAFSQGVKKVSTEEEGKEVLNRMLTQSELVIAQEYLPTDFDWRIGVLDGKPLYACKYFMAKGHWQIYNWSSQSTEDQSGEFQTLPTHMVPPRVIETALKATNLIGKGLYGVDVKETDGKVYIIEINDNPNLDFGVEDQILGDDLYERIIHSFIRRIEEHAPIRI
jgi:glutathione synthase/RimK-type ligase-like ATP-grasp enzyme